MRSIVKRVLPGPILNLIRLILESKYDLTQNLKRLFPPPHKGEPKHNLTPVQVYPFGTNFLPVLEQSVSQLSSPFRFNRSTRVASIGSCFAEEFAHFMLAKKYNFLRSGNYLFNNSCEWGRVYTVPALNQIVNYSFDSNYPIIVEPIKDAWFDPLREHSVGTFPSFGAATDAIVTHRAESKNILENAEVLVITLGQNETWYDTEKQVYWARRPPKNMIEAQFKRFIPKELSFQENVDLMVKTIKTLLTHKPDMRFICSISPVPANSTFIGSNVITQSFGNKCLLRAVIDEVCRTFPGQMIYFPSFEIVLAYNPHSLISDNRHVKRHTVRSIFSIFERSFFS